MSDESAEPAPLLLPSDTSGSILTAARLLRDGGVVAIPTDTVYGLAASVFQPLAIDRIFRIKRRAPDSAVPVLLATASDLHILVREVPRIAWRLIDRFWPGALTLVLPARDLVSSSITRGGNTVAVRVPGGRTTLELLQSLGEPVVGTSANLHGRAPAVEHGAILSEFGSSLDAILIDDQMPRTGGVSSVVELTDECCIIHREGSVSIADLRQALGLGYPLGVACGVDRQSKGSVN